MNKIKEYKGQKLKGNWLVTAKIDGVRAHKIGSIIVSRANKPLHNIPASGAWEIAEVFLGSWEQTVSAVRTKSYIEIPESAIYPLHPVIDSRLILDSVHEPSNLYIEKTLKSAVKKGYEGLVLYQKETGKRLKVKTSKTWDVVVTGIVEGKGKYVNRLGKFMTQKGGVGTGLTDEDRKIFYTKDIIGKVIEVEATSLTPSGKFRHPRFIRVRYDKKDT